MILVADASAFIALSASSESPRICLGSLAMARSNLKFCFCIEFSQHQGGHVVNQSTGACFADMGNHVLSLDVDPAKIKILEDSGIPVYEPS
jgi:hypothetical protein